MKRWQELWNQFKENLARFNANVAFVGFGLDSYLVSAFLFSEECDVPLQQWRELNSGVM
jgi:hypothetical protein